jgi:endonuclease III
MLGLLLSVNILSPSALRTTAMVSTRSAICVRPVATTLRKLPAMSAVSRTKAGAAGRTKAVAAAGQSARAKTFEGGTSVAVGKGRGSSATSPTPPRAKAGQLELEPPAGWRATYNLITELRSDRTAVVDSMGSEALAESAPCGTSKAELDYHTLISLMLSSQTKDTVNAATMVKLRAHGLSVGNILATSDEDLDQLIHAVGFHNNKVKFIKGATQILADKHGGRIPDTMEGLLELPGVGPKMALIVMRVAFGKTEGISVDTHVHRISNQLGWVGEGQTKTPEKTRAALEAWMPAEIWPDVNLLLVGFGQEIQTEKAKLLQKCLACSDSKAALALVARCGLDVDKELAKLQPRLK